MLLEAQWMIHLQRTPIVQTYANVYIKHASGHMSICPFTFARPHALQTIMAIEDWLLGYAQVLSTTKNAVDYIAMTDTWAK